MKTTATQIDLKLDAVELLVIKRHLESMRVIEDAILLALETGPKYPDDIAYLAFASSENGAEIGIAFRLLQRKGKIAKTGAYRRSLREASNGRLVWEYRLL